jgi:hypothetical protein
MLKRPVLGATLLALLMAPATAQSPPDWVPPPEAAQWAPGATDTLAIVQRLMPGLKGQELEKAQLSVAVDMAMLTTLVGRVEGSAVERMWERRFNAMYQSGGVDKTLNRWGITPSAIQEWMRLEGVPTTAMYMMTLAIAQREQLEEEIANGQNIAANREKLSQFVQDNSEMFGQSASNTILSRDLKYVLDLRQTIAEAGHAAAAARAKKSARSIGQGKR